MKQTNNEPQEHIRIAVITLAGKGTFKLPIVQEGSSGFFCRTGQGDSPACEYFPYSSPCGNSAVEI